MPTMLDHLLDVINAHDAPRMAALFAADYSSVQPVHPGRAFVGRPQVLENWTAVFRGVPDFAADLVARSVDGDREWGEWDWHGRHTDGTPFAMRGVTILAVRDGLITDMRLYLEPVESSEHDIAAAVEELYHPPPE